MLTAEKIEVVLGAAQVLHGVDFQAEAGQLTAIVGPNGSGKTTLLRVMTQDVPFRGRVTFNGENIDTFKAWELATRRAVLPQSSRLAFPFTVLEVVRLGLMASEDSRQHDLPLRALKKVGLEGYEGRFFQELSGGEQQRAQLARVLTQAWEPISDGSPRWLFLDEPVSSLDIGHQLEVMQIAKSYAERGGGVVAVMHDLNLTAMFADQVAFLHRGRCIASGPPEQVLTDPNLERAYGCQLRVNTTPTPGQTFVLPQSVASPEL